MFATWSTLFTMTTPSLPGCIGPEVLLEVPFCGFGDFLMLAYGLASIIALLWRTTTKNAVQSRALFMAWSKHSIATTQSKRCDFFVTTQERRRVLSLHRHISVRSYCAVLSKNRASPSWSIRTWCCFMACIYLSILNLFSTWLIINTVDLLVEMQSTPTMLVCYTAWHVDS